MTNARSRTAAFGAALAVVGVLGAAAPAAASSVTSAGPAASTQIRHFYGFGGSPFLATAIAQAESTALAKAAGAGARGCEVTDTWVDESDPYFLVAQVRVTCTR